MMRAVSLLIGLAVVAPYSHAGTHFPRMTGARLLERLVPVDPASAASSSSVAANDRVAYLRTRNNIEFVEGYLAALHDATEGTVWCYNSSQKNPKPDTFWDESRWGLNALPPFRLKENATDLLLEIWRKKWPCSSDLQRRNE